MSDPLHSSLMGNDPALARMRLLQLASASLPIGAFAFSHGLEQAVAEGRVADAAAAESWIAGLLEHVWGRWDLPLLARQADAVATGDPDMLARTNALLLAGRESAELAAEDRHTGMALARLLAEVQPEAAAWLRAVRPCAYATAFAVAGQGWGIPLADLATAYLWTLAEAQTLAAVRLVPLGQTDGQRILLSLGARIPRIADQALDLPDAAIGAFAPGLAMASARHETQYTRLFRS